LYQAGAAYCIRGIDSWRRRKVTEMEPVRRMVLMESEVTKSLAPSPQPLFYPTNVGRPLATSRINRSAC